MSDLTFNDLNNMTDLLHANKYENLNVFHYKTCNYNSPKTLKEARGVIANDERIIMRNFPFTPEYYAPFSEDVKSYLKNSVYTHIFFKSHEGTIIRMFYFEGEWRVWTNKRPANISFWGSDESFGSIFSTSIETQTNMSFSGFCDSLDINKQYMFLLTTNSKNRIVCNGQEVSKVFHVGTYVNDIFSIEEIVIGVSYPEKLDFESIDALEKYVFYTNSYESQGVMAICPSSYDFFKITNMSYRNLAAVRGNTSSLFYRYLQVSGTHYELLFKFLYPTKIQEFYENKLYIEYRCKQLHMIYIDRFVKKMFVVVPKTDHRLLMECHSLYKRTRVPITRDIMYRTAVSMGIPFMRLMFGLSEIL